MRTNSFKRWRLKAGGFDVELINFIMNYILKKLWLEDLKMKKYYIDTDIISKRFFVFKASDCLTDEEWKEKGFKHYDKEDFNIIVPINAPQSVYLRYPCSSKYIKIVSDIATKKAILEKERINNILVNLKNGDHILCKAQGYEGYVYFIKEDGKFNKQSASWEITISQGKISCRHS